MTAPALVAQNLGNGVVRLTWRSTGADTYDLYRTTSNPAYRNESVALADTALTGSYVLSYDGHDTAAIPVQSDAAAVLAALLLLPNLAPGQIECTDGDPGEVTIEFIGDLGGKNVPNLTVDDTLAVGGSVVLTITAGIDPIDIDITSPYLSPTANGVKFFVVSAVTAGVPEPSNQRRVNVETTTAPSGGSDVTPTPGLKNAVRVGIVNE